MAQRTDSQKFDGSAMLTYPGRPRIDAALEARILDMADNNRWGAMRIKGTVSPNSLISDCGHGFSDSRGVNA